MGCGNSGILLSRTTCTWLRNRCEVGLLGFKSRALVFWVAVKELELSYPHSKTIFGIYPYYGNLN